MQILKNDRIDPGGRKDNAPRQTYRFLRHPGPMMLWKTNQRCNFSCEYCFLPITDLSREHPLCGRYPAGDIARRFDETGRSWTIFMTGGEPFLYPGFLDLCRELAKNHFLAMNTNLSTSNVIRFADTIDPARVEMINASFHITVLERMGKVEEFLNHVRYFQDRGIHIGVEYVAYPPMFERLDRDLRMLETNGVRTVNLKVFRGFYGSKSYPQAYTPGEKDYFHRDGFDPEELNFIDKRFAYRGEACRTGMDFVFMDIVGRIRRCPGSAKSYGNFLAGDYALDRTARPCPFPRCFSPWIGREFAGGPAMSARETLKETIREAIPFVLNKQRIRLTFESLRSRFLK
jgi:MoaA/NifB/PqqE/SkfB family radical SAM enzyme